MYALTQNAMTGKRALVSSDGRRFEFPASDGGLLAEMLDDEFPECDMCQSRWETCPDCKGCRDCRTCECGEEDD